MTENAASSGGGVFVIGGTVTPSDSQGSPA
jgi:hypothetical protein